MTAYTFTRRGRFWAIFDGATLVAVVCYRKGCIELLRRLQEAP
mgnify:CR=1 FL=1